MVHKSCRAQQNQQSPMKGKGQGRDLKPPDLWIHDNMEMKNIDKGQRSESTLTMSTTRRSSNDYRSMDDLPPYHEDRSKIIVSFSHNYLSGACYLPIIALCTSQGWHEFLSCTIILFIMMKCVMVVDSCSVPPLDNTQTMWCIFQTRFLFHN